MRNKYFKILIMMTFTPILMATAISTQEIIEEIIAKVNDTIITRQELEEVAAPFMKEVYEKYQGEERIEQIKKMKAALLEEMINSALISHQARLYGFTVSESEIRATIDKIKEDNNIVSDEELERQLMMQGQSLDKLKEQIKRRIMQQRVFNQDIQPKIIITEAEVLNYYNKNIEDYTSKEEVRISQLVFPLDEQTLDALREEVMQIRARINDANDFVNMVNQYSENQEEQQNGDVGYFKRGELLIEIEKAAFSLEVGEISPVVETDRGFYIIHVTDKKPATKAPFEEVKQDIQNQILNQKMQEKMQEYIKELREVSYVEILRPVE